MSKAGITPEIAAHYADRGYAVVPAAVAPALTARIIAAIEAIQRHAGDIPPALAAKRIVFERELPDAKRNGVPAAATGDAIFILNDPPAFDPVFAELLLDETLLAHVRGLLGTGDIRLHFANATMKRGRIGSGVYWHRDFPNGYLCPTTPSFLRVMVCLDGMDAENGATVFRAGSQRAPPERLGRFEAADWAPLERAYCPPGSLVLIHPQVLHGGPPNASPSHRRNLVMQWGRADDPPTGPGMESLTNFSPDDIRAWARRAAEPVLPARLSTSV